MLWRCGGLSRGEHKNKSSLGSENMTGPGGTAGQDEGSLALFSVWIVDAMMKAQQQYWKHGTGIARTKAPGE